MNITDACLAAARTHWSEGLVAPTVSLFGCTPAGTFEFIETMHLKCDAEPMELLYGLPDSSVKQLREDVQVIVERFKAEAIRNDYIGLEVRFCGRTIKFDSAE